MPTTTPQQPPRPITARAAENGLIVSGCICLLLILCGLASTVPAAGLLLWAGSLSMPVVIYKILKRSYLSTCCSLTFAEVWAEGIASFFLGSMIPAVVAYVLLKFAFPDFVAHQLDYAVESFKAMGTPQGDQWAATMEHIRAHSPMPTAADIAANIISFNIVAGTVLSLLVTPLVKLRNKCTGCPSDNNKL